MGCACSTGRADVDEPVEPGTFVVVGTPVAEPGSTRYEGGAWTAQPIVAEKSKRTWAEAAGRSKGGDGYKFGDCTRSIAGVVKGDTDRGWKDAAGRKGGKESYQFGDLTRVALSNLFGDKHRNGDGMGTMPKPDPLFGSTAELGLGHAPSLLDGLWLGFFNSSYAVGRLALGSFEISIEAIEDAEPAVLLGIPSLAAIECAIRSAAVAKDGCLIGYEGKSVNAAKLKAASLVDRSRGRGTGANEAMALFDSMLQLAQRVATSRLSPPGLALLRARALATSGTDDRATTGAAEEAEINGLVALSQSVATRISQLPLYKEAFNRVLETLVNPRRHEEDMLKMLTTLSAPTDSSATRGKGNRRR